MLNEIYQVQTKIRTGKTRHLYTKIMKHTLRTLRSIVPVFKTLAEYGR